MGINGAVMKINSGGIIFKGERIGDERDGKQVLGGL